MHWYNLAIMVGVGNNNKKEAPDVLKPHLHYLEMPAIFCSIFTSVVNHYHYYHGMPEIIGVGVRLQISKFL